MRVLGIDFGSSRTGLALSDPMGVTCSPLETVEERDENRLLEKIVAVTRREEVGEIVVGFPRPLGGGSNAQSNAAVAFGTRLQAMTAVPVRMWDERFTSKLAAKGRKTQAAQDAIAACYMLQSYLDSHAEHMEDS